MIAPAIGSPVDERSMKDGLGFLERYLPVVDKQLSENKYLAGNELSLADFNLLAHLEPAEVVSVNLSPYIALTKWRAELQERDFRKQCYSDYSEVIQALMK